MNNSYKKLLLGRSIKCIRKWFLIFIGMCIIVLIYFGYQENRADVCGRTDHDFIRAQLKLPETNKSHLNFVLKSNEKLNLSSELSNIIQKQIREIQFKSCSEPNFLCGHSKGCGFGCQFHHRVGCLILSYATNLPLIHNDGWSYNNKWVDVFQKLGSNCTPGPNTYEWIWDKPYFYIKQIVFPVRSQYCHNFFEPPYFSDLPRLTYPLRFGFPIRAQLGSAIEKLDNEPVLWLIGQFVKYAFKLNEKFEEELKQWRRDIGLDFTAPIVGLQVRRTDKYEEAPNSFHEIDDYMTEAEKYFKDLELNFSIPLKRKVFIASDDINNILKSAKRRYPLWEIYGFESKLGSRREGLFEIVRDISILSNCNYVVCGLSSNVCRLIFEIFSSKFPDAENHLKSLDDLYTFPLLFHGMQVKNVWSI